MTKTKTEREAGTRSHEHELTIDAPPEAVWRAITEAQELVNWFPLDARTEPGPQGSITYTWAPDMVGACRILAWDPPRHLRTSWMEPAASGATADPAVRQVAVDWFIEGRGGRTVLRLVHSGFGPGAEWDTEFDGTRRGWDYELRSLKHYLERHRGRTRRAFWLRHPVELAPSDVWGKLARGGFVREGLSAGLAPGSRYRATLASGEAVEGTVLIHEPPDFAGTVDGFNNGLFRLGYDICAGGPEATVWLSAWGVEREAFESTRERWATSLRRAFGA